MKKNLLKFTFTIISFFSLLIIYFTIFGLETEKFNSQIKNKIYQTNQNLEIELKKIKFTLSPLVLKINAKTIAPKIFYKDKKVQLEYIKTQISLISLIKNKIVSSKLTISTKSILLKDLVKFSRAITNKSELFILENLVKNGQGIVNIDLNFDENGKIKKDYKISLFLKDGKIKLFRNYNFEKINFSLNVYDNFFDFKDISFIANKSKFYSESLKITKNKEDFLIEGVVKNKNTILNTKLIKLLNIDIKNIRFLNTNFDSINEFSFTIDKRFKIKDLAISSDIQINNLEYQKPSFLDNYFLIHEDIIKIKNHKIKSTLKNNKLSIKGSGKIKLQDRFDKIKYNINLKDKNFNLTSQLTLSELKFNSPEYLKSFIPNLDKFMNLKDQKIEINFDKKGLTVKGLGKIKLVNDFENIKFDISKFKNEFNFNTQLDLKKTLIKIDFLNFKKTDNLDTQINILGSYNGSDKLNLKDFSIIDNKNKIKIENILLNQNNQIKKVDKIDLEYFDNQNKKNKILLTRNKENNYQIKGTTFNADKLIDGLISNKRTKHTKFFKNDFSLSLDLKEVYLDNKNIINNLLGEMEIKNNKVYAADVNGSFDNDDYLKFTINTNNNGKKITTLFSSKAKPIVSRYKFIKGYEDGYLDFYSSKKNNISKSKLKIYDFKLQELPVLTKLLTLASLQGIADTLSGEGIRFNEFEMNFINKNNLMTIDEIYAIGPAISILMSGYIEENKLISLRGTMVPATTINKTIGSIPILGKLLVGDKTGEGVFGVSFKIKGSPKKLETTVNPIKTLTPRFITRTLEKIKKN